MFVTDVNEGSYIIQGGSVKEIKLGATLDHITEKFKLVSKTPQWRGVVAAVGRSDRL